MKKLSKVFLGLAIAVIVLMVGWFAFVVVIRNLQVANYVPMMDGGFSHSVGGESYGIDMMGETGLGAVGAPMMKYAAPRTEQITLSNNTVIDRMIVRNGSFSVVVNDVNKAIEQVVALATAKGGYLLNTNVYKQGLSPYGEVMVKVPAKEFDGAVATLRTFGQVKSERVDGRDVTEEFVDLDAQLNNLKNTEKRFTEILAKAEKVDEILNIERELSNVRGQIDSLTGRMKYLQQSADFATLTVNFSTDPSVLPAVDETERWQPWAEVKNAARAFLGAIKGLSYVMIWLIIFIPLWIILGVVIWLGVRFYRHRKDSGVRM